MKTFIILTAIGLAFVMIGGFIETRYDDCLSDFRIENVLCASESVIAFGRISFFVGLACVFGAYAFRRKRKTDDGIFGN